MMNDGGEKKNGTRSMPSLHKRPAAESQTQGSVEQEARGETRSAPLSHLGSLCFDSFWILDSGFQFPSAKPRNAYQTLICFLK